MLLGPTGHLHIEPGVIDENQHIGCERRDIGLTLAHLPFDGPQITKHLHDTEERSLAVMLPQVHASARLGHAVAAPKTEFGCRVDVPKPPDEVGAMQIARRLACYQIIFHLN